VTSQVGVMGKGDIQDKPQIKVPKLYIEIWPRKATGDSQNNKIFSWLKE
jgi:hypothetical protein